MSEISRLPLLISIPHGATAAPSELQGRIGLGASDLFHDTDPFTREIYDVGEHAWSITADIARAFVDLNRAPDDFPENNPDGVIKRTTCYGVAVYIPGHEPQRELQQRLLQRYYYPYHQSIARMIDEKPVELALDCHSMAASAPPIAPDQGARPLFCLGDRHGVTAPPQLTQRLKQCLCRAFSLAPHQVVCNRPFSGGYITRKHGAGDVPWVQVEMSRALYLTSPWFDFETLQIEPQRLRELNDRFLDALHLFFLK